MHGSDAKSVRSVQFLRALQKNCGINNIILETFPLNKFNEGTKNKFEGLCICNLSKTSRFVVPTPRYLFRYYLV